MSAAVTTTLNDLVLSSLIDGVLVGVFVLVVATLSVLGAVLGVLLMVIISESICSLVHLSAGCVPSKESDTH